MTADLSHFSSVFPSLMEAIAIASSLAVIFIDWNHNLRERSQLRFLQSYLPQWRNQSARQGSYTCLVILALAVIYNNSMKNFAINLQNCLFAGASLVVLLSFWLQSKIKVLNTSNKSVGGSPVILRDQGINASTCCGARVPQYLLSLPTSSVPQCEVNIEEEMKEPYVLAFRSHFDLEEVSNEKLATAIRYLNTLRGGIEAHRDSNKLMNAVDHIDSMRSRLDDSGFPQEYSYEELHHIVVEENKYPFEDFERVVGKCLESSGFLPSPEEFAEIHHDMKVQLEREVAETSQALERTQRVVEETTQVVVESQQQNMVRELELNPEGVLQRRLHELEEEIHRLSAQSKRALCKICHDKEVQVSFYPCKHLISCEGCVDSLPEKTCPMCRKPIQDTIRMYFA
uniref:Baculoviral IAP repeat-containing protein 2 n=1 Tax=Magallana gigas TaxID=29159 RepID=K1R211_MAGGI